MEIEFDREKSRENGLRRGLPFSRVATFDFETALVAEDTRIDYGEVRFVAIGKIGQRLHVVAYTMRGEALRVISLRRANEREAARYDKARP